MHHARVIASLRRLLLGFTLIGLASAVLLFSDLGSRVGEAPAVGPKKRVALMQHASQFVLDQGRDGVLAGLREGGYTVGVNLDLKLYNAEGDIATAQTIAREMTGSGSDLLFTISTVSLQSVANANKAGKTPHVFALVSDPAAAGVGISRDKPLEHPAHLAGYGTMQPIALAFRLAREMNPALATVGVVWNAAEANSEAQVKAARAICAELGINLMESTVDNSAGVVEAANALISRGVEAIWMGGDVTVMTALDALMAATRKARIPAFTVIPPNVKKGALFDIGADYPEVGRLAGKLAAEILSGRSPATVPITNVLPEMLTLNEKAAVGLKQPWTFTADHRKRATLVIDADGVEHAVAATGPPNPTGKKWKIAVVTYVEAGPSEETLAGLKAGFKKSALVEGKDYEISYRSAQGDFAALNGIFDAIQTERADIVVPLATPTLQAAIKKVKNVPVVFTMVANPVIAGAGKSYTDHLPNMTGVAVLAPVESILDTIQKHFPQYRKIGTLFCPAEANSVDLKDLLEAAAVKRGMTLTTVAVNSPSELTDAALSLASRPIDAIVQISDNITSAGFNAVTKAARQARKPLISLNSTTVKLGAPIAMGRDYFNSGEVTVGMIERVIRGENPAAMPFVLPPKLFFSASPENARAVGMVLPPALLKELDKVVQ